MRRFPQVCSMSSSSSSSSSSSELPYFCPRCGDQFRFSSVPELRAHLVSRHTYETLLVLSQARVRSSRPGALLPLPDQAASQRQSSSLGMRAPSLPLPLACLDLASSSASIQLLRDMFGPSGDPPPSSSGPPGVPSTALALPGSVGPLPGQSLGLQLGLDLGLSVGIGLEERLGLGLDHKIARTFAEVEERVNRRMGRLKAELQRREAELERERSEGERLKCEKQEVEDKAAYLARQVTAAMEMMERLKTEMDGKERELNERHQEMVDIECFLRETAEKEAEAKSRLQVFIETLLERADRAERQLLLLSSHHNRYARHSDRYARADPYANPYSLDEAYTPVLGRGGRSLDASTDDIIAGKMQGTIGNRRSYSVSGSYRLGEQLYNQHHYSGPTSRMRTLSLGSGGWDGEGGFIQLHPNLYASPWTRRERGGDGRRERQWVGESGCGRTWNKRNHRHHSTEEEEEEDEDEDGEEEQGFWSSAEMRRLIFARTHTPGSVDIPSSLDSTPSRRHGDRNLGADTLKLRAGLFCVFPYLDVRSLLRAAEVCSDWRFVARHPAVWTRVRLENARVSTEFLTTLSQWCTQTQSVVLNNLKPRNRRANETREDYHKITRGSVEPGVEALLRSAGGSLLHLSVSQCPHILTDRTMWLASCYSRNLQTLTYRSSSDPLGQEVLWALGAGCRNISTLQVAPAHPCQQPTRFGNRCLQTIGRCWPHLYSLSVGGAGCGTQGLVALVRSCAHLQVLELERITDLGLQAATDLCEAGLKSLKTLILTHTPVSGQAILHFHSVCENIRSIVVEVSVSDYFEEPDTEESLHLFGEILTTLKVLQKRPGLCDVLKVKAEGFC